MDLSAFSYGQIVFFAGIALTCVSVLALIIGTIAFSIKRKALKKQLTDKYGF